MLFFRFILAIASPEFRESYGEALRRDIRDSLTDHQYDRAFIARTYFDLFSAVVMERLNIVMREFVYAVRSFVRTPGLTIVMILTLALGLGANVAAFSIASGVLLHPLPFDNPDRIVTIYRVTNINGFHCTMCPHSAYTAFAYRDRSQLFEGIAPFARWNGTLLSNPGEPAINVRGALVGRQIFDIVGTHALLGRLLTVADEQAKAPPVAIASYQFWKSQLHADAAAL